MWTIIDHCAILWLIIYSFITTGKIIMEKKMTADVKELQLTKTSPRKILLREAVEESLLRYLEKIDHGAIHELYNIVMREVEAPLLKTILEHTNNNQSHAASLLGINRGTLRKKLKEHGLD